MQFTTPSIVLLALGAVVILAGGIIALMNSKAAHSVMTDLLSAPFYPSEPGDSDKALPNMEFGLPSQDADTTPYLLYDTLSGDKPKCGDIKVVFTASENATDEQGHSWKADESKEVTLRDAVMTATGDECYENGLFCFKAACSFDKFLSTSMSNPTEDCPKYTDVMGCPIWECKWNSQTDKCEVDPNGYSPKTPVKGGYQVTAPQKMVATGSGAWKMWTSGASHVAGVGVGILAGGLTCILPCCCGSLCMCIGTILCCTAQPNPRQLTGGIGP